MDDAARGIAFRIKQWHAPFIEKCSIDDEGLSSNEGAFDAVDR